MKRISFAGPSITQREIDAVTDAVKNGWYETYDKDIIKLEKTVCDYLGMKYSKSTFCCTHALHLAVRTLGIGEGDEVICPNFSWAATINAIMYERATPILVDIDPKTFNIDPDKIEEQITSKTKAIMIVHSFGMPCDMDKIMAICVKYNLRLIEDAAPAMGSRYKGQLVGTFGDIGCFSFHGAKITASGEGGIMVTDNRTLHERNLHFGGMARTNRINGRYVNFACEDLGYEYPISNIQAALAAIQVERINELVAIKRNIFNQYRIRLNGVRGIRLIEEPSSDYFSNYCYPAIVLEEGIDRQMVLDKLAEKDIHARATFPPFNELPYIRSVVTEREMRKHCMGDLFDAQIRINVYKKSFPNTKLVSNQGLNLPSAANLTEHDIDRVCQELRRII